MKKIINTRKTKDNEIFIPHIIFTEKKARIYFEEVLNENIDFIIDKNKQVFNRFKILYT